MGADETKPGGEIRRILGDEWSDWDGTIDHELGKTRKTLFHVISIMAVIAIAGLILLFEWLIRPRMLELLGGLANIIRYLFFGISGLIILWLLIFIVGSIFRVRLLAPVLLVPRAINFVLNLTLKFAGFLGIPRDRVVNSFMKLHGLLARLRRTCIRPQELLVLLPRCLTRECLERLQQLKEHYKFQMLTVGGGTQARQKIRKLMPRAIIAVACERDLLSGFTEVNRHIPVIGFPNVRPNGPCLNTEIDPAQIEAAVKHLLCSERGIKNNVN